MFLPATTPIEPLDDSIDSEIARLFERCGCGRSVDVGVGVKTSVHDMPSKIKALAFDVESHRLSDKWCVDCITPDT